MANIEDYLDWRGDIGFDVDPFNEVDNLVLCELAYADFDDIVPGPGIKEKITIEEACKRFFEKYSDEEILAGESVTKYSPFLMRKMINTKRFGGMKMSGFVNEIDSTTQTQFSVVTYFLNDGTIFVAFRGTDNTLVGWKEDFNMCFMTHTKGQERAAQYLSETFIHTKRPIRVGGHSKGGNFAVYGSAFCRLNVRDKIFEVYSNDGPGFEPQITGTPEYKSVLKKVRSTMPECSIIGMLMDNEYKNNIIETSKNGIMAHDGLTWQVLRNRFVESDGLVEESIMIDKTIKKWYKDVDNETRGLFLDIVFSPFLENGYNYMSEVSGAKLRSFLEIKKAIDKLPDDQKNMFMEILKKLAVSSGETIKDSLLEKVSELQISNKREKLTPSLNKS